MPPCFRLLIQTVTCYYYYYYGLMVHLFPCAGTFQGQWMRGMRHGYGVRTSAPFGMASHSKPPKTDIRNSLSSLGLEDAPSKAGPSSEDPVIGSEGRDKKLDDTRGGFVLKANSEEQPSRRKTLVSKSTHSLKRTFMSVSTRQTHPRNRFEGGATILNCKYDPIGNQCPISSINRCVYRTETFAIIEK